jgi:hypothetical protein
MSSIIAPVSTLRELSDSEVENDVRYALASSSNCLCTEFSMIRTRPT